MITFVAMSVYIGAGITTFSISILLIKSISTNGETGIFLMLFGIAFLAISLLLLMTSFLAINKFFIKLSNSGPLFNYQGVFYKIDRITEKASEVLMKIYYGAFLCFWFTMIIMTAVLSIKDQNYSMLLFLVPFLLVGILLVKKTVSKK